MIHPASPRGLRWAGRVLPVHLIAALAYVAVLAAELPRITEELRSNSDVASVLLVGHSLADGTAGRPIEAGQPAYAWLVAAFTWIGHQTAVWSLVPLVIAWLGLAGIVLAVARVAGRWPAGLALAIGAGAAPAVVLTEVAPAFHGMVWGAAGLVGWYAVVVAGDRTPTRRLVVLSLGAGLIAGVVAASDALVLVVALGPLAVTTLLAWWPARHRRRALPPIILLGTALLGFAAVHLAMARAGYSSGLGGGSTRGLHISALTANARVVGRGLIDMADGLPMQAGAPVSPLPVVLAVGLIAAVALAIVVVVARELHRGGSAGPADLAGSAARRAHTTYWVTSAVLLVGALIVSNVVMPGGDAPPADRLVSSQRYVPGLFFAAVALAPLWPRGRLARVVATVVATMFIAASGTRLVAAASNDDFQPSASQALPLLTQALASHGLSHGYASYWIADVLRLQSAGALYVVPAAEGTQCGGDAASFCRDLLNSVGGWFSARPGRSFVVEDPTDIFIPAPPPASLGVPVETFSAGRFTVYVYATDVLPSFASTCAGRADHRCAG